MLIYYYYIHHVSYLLLLLRSLLQLNRNSLREIYRNEKNDSAILHLPCSLIRNTSFFADCALASAKSPQKRNFWSN